MNQAIPGRREQVCDALRESAAPRTISSLADEVGVHLNTVRFHLDGLIRSGRAERVAAAPSGPGRPPALFRAVRRMDSSGPTNYRLLATMLTSNLRDSTVDPVGAAVRIGRDWGPRLLDGGSHRSARTDSATAVQQLIGVLDDLGFEPERPFGPDDLTIRLRHCPFLDLVVAEDGVGDQLVCALHLGLMQGALDAMGSPVTVDHLDPFAEPDLCVGHLAKVRSASAGRGQVS